MFHKSYELQMSSERTDELQIWEAARATVVASSFFDLMEFDRNGQISTDVIRSPDSPIRYI